MEKVLAYIQYRIESIVETRSVYFRLSISRVKEQIESKINDIDQKIIDIQNNEINSEDNISLKIKEDIIHLVDAIVRFKFIEEQLSKW